MNEKNGWLDMRLEHQSPVKYRQPRQMVANKLNPSSIVEKIATHILEWALLKLFQYW